MLLIHVLPMPRARYVLSCEPVRARNYHKKRVNMYIGYQEMEEYSVLVIPE